MSRYYSDLELYHICNHIGYDNLVMLQQLKLIPRRTHRKDAPHELKRIPSNPLPHENGINVLR